MSATAVEKAERHAAFLAGASVDWLEDGLRYHTRLRAHGKATPASIARHEVGIAALRAEIARRRERPTFRALPTLPRRQFPPWQARVRNEIAEMMRQQFRLVV